MMEPYYGQNQSHLVIFRGTVDFLTMNQKIWRIFEGFSVFFIVLIVNYHHVCQRLISLTYNFDEEKGLPTFPKMWKSIWTQCQSVM
jgi:hypothetical protein